MKNTNTLRGGASLRERTKIFLRQMVFTLGTDSISVLQENIYEIRSDGIKMKPLAQVYYKRQQCLKKIQRPFLRF